MDCDRSAKAAFTQTCSYRRPLDIQASDIVTPRLKQAYLDITDRSIRAGRAAENDGVHEKACFMSYHAFESLGGALSASRHQAYPRPHPAKLNQFVRLASGRPYQRAVAYLASALWSLRAESLYPRELADGRVLHPRDMISATDAKRLVSRIAGLHRKMARDLK